MILGFVFKALHYTELSFLGFGVLLIWGFDVSQFRPNTCLRVDFLFWVIYSNYRTLLPLAQILTYHFSDSEASSFSRLTGNADLLALGVYPGRFCPVSGC